jgi:hypothetical protein
MLFADNSFSYSPYRNLRETMIILDLRRIIAGDKYRAEIFLGNHSVNFTSQAISMVDILVEGDKLSFCGW